MFGARCNASTNFKTQLNHNAMNTQTPWRIHDKTELTVVAQNNRTVANTGTYNSNIDSEKVHNENVANAELIVRAVNYHDRLVDELAKLSDEYKKLFTIYVKDGNPNFTFDMCDEVAKNNQNYVSAQQLLTEIKESK